MTMKTFRGLLNGEKAESFEKPIDLIIHTKCPSKWKIIDMETGEEYIGSSEMNIKFKDYLINRVANGIIGQWNKIS